MVDLEAVRRDLTEWADLCERVKRLGARSQESERLSEACRHVESLLAEVDWLRAQVHECPECGERCKDCACVRKRHDELLDAVTAERATVERLRAVLRKCEWKGKQFDDHGDIVAACLLLCGGTPFSGHAAGCELAAALKGREG